MSDTRTLGRMIKRISRELRRDGLTADIRDAIATSVDHYKSDRFWFNETEATATLTVGVDVYDLPTDYLELDTLHLEDSAGQKYDLDPVSIEEMQEIQTQTRAFPEVYCIYRDQLYVRPVTYRALQMRMGYLRNIELSASASNNTSNAWTTDAEPMIRKRAKAEVFEHRLRNRAQAERMAAEAERERMKLTGRTVSHADLGRVRKTSF